jgi:N-acetylmuramoyl-L-alanine amidase
VPLETCSADKKKEKAVPDIVFPLENQVFPFIANSFIFGSTHPGSSLTVNGEVVKVHENGAFFAFMPVTEGTFVFTVKSDGAEGAFEAKRTIRIEKEIRSSAEGSAEIQPHFMEPSKPLTVQPGEAVLFRMMGTPGRQAFMSLEGGTEKHPLKETAFQAFKGVYTGTAAFSRAFDAPKKIVFELYDGEKQIASRTCAQTLMVRAFGPEEVFEVKEDFVKAMKEPGGEHRLLLFKGMQLAASGEEGPCMRLGLSAGENVFVEKKDIAPVKKTGALAAAKAGALSVNESKGRVLVSVACDRKVPYSVEEKFGENTLVLRLFSAAGEEHSAKGALSGGELQVASRREADDVLAVTARLPFRPVWGWEVFFNGGRMTLSVRKPPAVNRDRPLKGLTICLDPGHNPGPGAVGPTRLEEREINWTLADRVKAVLEKEGAKVVMTRRRASSKAELRDRVAKAVESGCDLFVSIHNNSASNGKNPYEVSGTETYYFAPSARVLADAVQAALVKDARMKDRGVHFGNLHVLRNPAVPSVLVEAAYIVLPEQERLLREKEFQDSFASCLAAGIKIFVLQEGKVL